MAMAFTFIFTLAVGQRRRPTPHGGKRYKMRGGGGTPLHCVLFQGMLSVPDLSGSLQVRPDYPVFIMRQRFVVSAGLVIIRRRLTSHLYEYVHGKTLTNTGVLILLLVTYSQ